jgi:hypothetical protein
MLHYHIHGGLPRSREPFVVPPPPYSCIYLPYDDSGTHPFASPYSAISGQSDALSSEPQLDPSALLHNLATTSTTTTTTIITTTHSHAASASESELALLAHSNDTREVDAVKLSPRTDGQSAEARQCDLILRLLELLRQTRQQHSELETHQEKLRTHFSALQQAVAQQRAELQHLSLIGRITARGKHVDQYSAAPHAFQEQYAAMRMQEDRAHKGVMMMMPPQLAAPAFAPATTKHVSRPVSASDAPYPTYLSSS